MPYDPDTIKPMGDDELKRLKNSIENRWKEKPHYDGLLDDPLSSPGCVMRSKEVLSLVKRAEMTRLDKEGE